MGEGDTAGCVALVVCAPPLKASQIDAGAQRREEREGEHSFSHSLFIVLLCVCVCDHLCSMVRKGDGESAVW